MLLTLLTSVALTMGLTVDFTTVRLAMDFTTVGLAMALATTSRLGGHTGLNSRNGVHFLIRTQKIKRGSGPVHH